MCKTEKNVQQQQILGARDVNLTNLWKPADQHCSFPFAHCDHVSFTKQQVL